MKKVLLAILTLTVATSCNQGKEGKSKSVEQAQVVEPARVYQGVFPLADGSDSITLTLNTDSAFVKQSSVDGMTDGVYYIKDSLLYLVRGTDTTYYAYKDTELTLLGPDKKPAASGLPYVLKLSK